ncbi:hypothetical protein [Pseudoalteromonas byunsanensis]|uniref:SnoaL-like domain-containing protein n=1 Tax=Pseudoalteromonas byunsanensis TaxID=327939 RepID=A0A1S1N997_9GAMM|nr:hypothetical protein [Pseudoalteromonas byunsanensis]OHU96238.1 hypothetical protein BIW53_06750 [Pseudoalteromonas byunsanensis]
MIITLNFSTLGIINARHHDIKIVTMIAGHDAVSVERQQIHEGKTENHLTVLEFKGQKVSKIIEYWK